MPASVRSFSIQRCNQSGRERALDAVAVEEPLSIRVEHWFKGAPMSANLALTMRTPGNDRELAAGYLFSEGLLQQPSHLVSLRALGPNPSNEIVAELSPHVDVDAWRNARHTLLNSSCGVCGKRSLDALLDALPEAHSGQFSVSPALIEKLPAILSRSQQGFASTGGLHAAALVNGFGEPVVAFEDIGRHNALDKLVGHSFLHGLTPLQEYLLFLSSRSSFELVQKTIMAGAPILATVGSPSSLAIETAVQYGVTLIGFVREGRFNVYSGEWRIKS